MNILVGLHFTTLDKTKLSAVAYHCQCI